MRQKFQGSTRVKRAQLQALRRDFEVLHMKEGETVNAYFARTLAIANKMKACGETMQENTITEKILRSMVSKFDYVVCSIEESNNLETLSLDELQSSLLVHEQRMRGHNEEEHALKVTSGRRFGAREDDRLGGRGRTSGGFRGRGRGRGRLNKAIVECYKCHKLGHFQYECPEWEKAANYAELDESEEMLLMAYVEMQGSRREEVWFLDSGCSKHLTGDRVWFSDLDEGFRQTVKLGNNTRMNVMGKGTIRLSVEGFVQVVSGVFYIPELKNNLLSVGQLQEKGLAILIQNNMCKTFHPSRGLIVESSMIANRMFVMLAAMSPKESTCFQATCENETQLWHRRLGHLNYKGLRTLHYKKMVKGLPFLKAPTKVCSDCLIGKQHRDTIPKKSHWRATKQLQLVHADLCGPVNPESNSGKRYLITFIDDLSRKCWVYFLSKKSESLSMFKRFKSIVERESGALICCLRTDRGGEFTSKEFNDFCIANGIKRQLTAAYTPQQNGVAERKNRSIMNLVRSMLSEKKVPNEFWPEAVNWRVHILNRSPAAAVKDCTPQEAWCGVKPSVEYFRVFGCIANVHISDEKRTKLDPKSFKCVLLGVSEETNGYKLYNPVTKKIMVSRDVVFEETEGWNWSESVEETKCVPLEWGDEDEVIDSEEEELDEEQNEQEEEAMVPTHEGNESEVPSTSSSSAATPASSPPQEASPELTQARNRRTPFWMEDYVTGEELSENEEALNMVLYASGEDPNTFEEASNSLKWREAMDNEIRAIEKNGTWELADLPQGARKIRVKWIFKTKLNERGEVDKFKARLVAKGYAQQHGVDYGEFFAPMARWDTIRLILALAAQRK
ncbi:hypothetical protein ABKV19_003159 [Rosa sericea]